MQRETEIIRKPFTSEQVKALNAYQELGITHPYTCALRSQHPGEGVLIATAEGWKCPDLDCNYTQDWALESTANPQTLEGLRNFSASLRAKLTP